MDDNNLHWRSLLQTNDAILRLMVEMSKRIGEHSEQLSLLSAKVDALIEEEIELNDN
jgi:hypothetical protein